MLRIELKSAPGGQPGWGELSVHGWQGGAEGLELSVLRNQDGRYLDAAGGWDSVPVWHAIDGLGAAGGGLGGEVGPWLVDPLVRDPKMVYRLQLRGGELSDAGVLRIVGNLLSSPAGGSPAPVVEAPPEPEPVAAEPEPPVPEPVEPPAIERPPADTGVFAERDEELQPPPKPRKAFPWLPLLLLLGLLLAAGLGAYWYFVLRPQTQAPVSAPPAAAGAAAGGEAAACGAPALEESDDDLAFIQGCLKSGPASDRLLEVIAAAKQAGRCGVVQRLYAYKAQAGDAAIAFAYAREYDPQSFSSGGCIESADAETAVYWYEIALANDAGNAEARQRLEALKNDLSGEQKK